MYNLLQMSFFFFGEDTVGDTWDKDAKNLMEEAPQFWPWGLMLFSGTKLQPLSINNHNPLNSEKHSSGKATLKAL